MLAAVLILGLMLGLTAIKGNTSEVFAQIEKDMLGSDGSAGFLLWAGAILFLAAVGAILQIPRAAKMFIALVLVVYIVKQKGLWANAENALASARAPAPASVTSTGQATNALDQPASAGASAGASGAAIAPASATPGAYASSLLTAGSGLLAGVLKG